MKKLLTFLTLFTLSIGVGWAAEVTISKTMAQIAEANNWVTASGNGAQTCYTSFLLDDNISVSTTGNPNCGSFWGSDWRIYQAQGGNVIISAANGYALKSVTFTFTNSNNGTLNHGSDRLTSGSSYGINGSSVEFTVSRTGDGTNGQIRITAISVTYEEGGTTPEPDPTAPSGTISFNPVAGEVTSGTTVAMTFSGSCTGIKYTTDGTSPDATNGTVYDASNPPAINEATTITAAAYNYSNSTYAFGTEATASYTIATIPEIEPDGSATFVAGIDVGTSTDPNNTDQIIKSPVTFYSNNAALATAEYRLYQNSTTTFSVPTGYKIVKIEFTGVSSYPVSRFNSVTGLTTSGNDGTWIGEAQSISFTASAQVRCSKIQVYYTAPTSTGPNFYLVGSFNGWTAGDANYKFVEVNGTYYLDNVNLPANAEFKFVTPNGDDWSWYGGRGNVVYNIHHTHHEGLDMDGGQNFTIQSAGSTSFSFTLNNNTPGNLNVNREPKLYIKGDFNSWAEDAMTATAEGWTTTKDLAINDQFGFIDEFGQWRGTEWTIYDVNIGQVITLGTNGNYKMDIAGNYNINVNSGLTELVLTAVSGDNTYTLVTAVNELNVNDEYIIASSKNNQYYAMGGQGNNNRSGTSITVNGNTAIATDAVEVFSLEGNNTDGWYFHATKLNLGYLYAASSSSNYLRTEVEKDANALANITISTSGEASVIFQGTNTHNVMQYNSGSNIFACYESASQSPVYLYKKVSPLAKPAITPESQTVKGGLLEGVMITAETGATIHYTLDGTDPTTGSPVFDGTAFVFNNCTGGQVITVKAIAEMDNKVSAVASRTYTFQAPSSPTISPAGGTYEEPVEVTITSTDGGIIYYLVDPTEAPTNAAAVIAANQVYTEGETEIILSENGTYKVYAAVDLNGITSWAQATYTINIPVTLDPPMFFTFYGEELSNGDYIEEGMPIGPFSEYEDGVVYYVIDPSSAPTAEEICEDGEEFDYEGNGILLAAGQHTIYAVVKVGDSFSPVASITLNVYEPGDWRLVDVDTYFYSDVFEYIVVTADHTKVLGTYEDGHFNAIDCANNIMFDPNYETATINNDNIKLFSIETITETDDNGHPYDIRFLKDNQNTYYSFANGTVNTANSEIDIMYNYFGNNIILKDPNGNTNLGYYDNSFGIYENSSPVIMYYRPKNLTLAGLIANTRASLGQAEFTIQDELVAVECMEHDGYVNLWCKDQGNVSVEKTTNPDPENIEDYMRANHFFNQEWDQSNWLLVVFENANLQEIKSYIGYHIKAGTLKGACYINRQGHALYTTSKTLELVEDASTEFTPNLYCPANFLTANHNGNATGHGAYDYKKYFFVNPKIEEICNITFAVWTNEGGSGYFTLPAPSATANKTDIYGAFNVDWTYNKFGDVSGYLNDHVGQVYEFSAIVREPSHASKDGETVTPQSGVQPDGMYIVYPYNFNPEENIITGIETVNMLAGNGEVKSIKYINVAGIESATPFQGMNIVVTEYTDGTRTTTKMLKK